MADKHSNDKNRGLFGKAISDAKPIKQDRIGPFRRTRAPVPVQSRLTHQAMMRSLLSDGPDDDDIETGEELAFMRPGLQGSVWRKFRRGHYAIEADLDLHGLFVPEARDLVDAFLQESCRQGRRCVRIVHGKGLSSAGHIPVLKTRVNHWLRQKHEVLAFASARSAHGGTGAVYVLLRRL
ncbi:MAG: Smr/MutS family protein [Acidiferrobacteraceae bacterium]